MEYTGLILLGILTKISTIKNVIYLCYYDQLLPYNFQLKIKYSSCAGASS